jgi:hypothetical protein
LCSSWRYLEPAQAHQPQLIYPFVLTSAILSGGLFLGGISKNQLRKKWPVATEIFAGEKMDK